MPFDQISASRAVLIEVENILGAFRTQLVLVGGWVPELRYPNRGHVGSLDVDLAVSPEAVSTDAYSTILKRLTDAGYRHKAPPTHFLKDVEGAPGPVKVDLISGQYHDGMKVDSIRVNELQLHALRGLDLAFLACDEMEIHGFMPDGSTNVVRGRGVRPEAFILIKAFALDDRTKEKDAYDIAFVLSNYPSLTDLGARVRGLLGHGLAREGYSILKAKFATLESVGPVWAGRAYAEAGDDEQQRRRAAFEDAQELFRHVDDQP